MAETIQFNQGDDYTLRLNNFNPEHNYKVYIQMFDEDGNFVGTQLDFTTNYSDSLDITLNSAYTDGLTVPLGEDYQLYYLGGKQAEIIVNKQDLYAWKYSDTIVYTHSDYPSVGDDTYTDDDEETGDTISAVTMDEEQLEVVSITSDSVTYGRSVMDDTEKIISTYETNEKTIISELANKRPVIVYKKRAEGPA